MNIGFAILLNDESHNYARQMELTLCQKFGLCWGLRQPPHITIKSPFETDDVTPFNNYLENLARNIAPFEIELDVISYFEPKVIFIDVKENFKLTKLHFKILDDMKSNFNVDRHELEGENIKFHSTLSVLDVTEEKFYQAKKYLRNEHPNFKFKVEKLGIFYDLGEDFGWIISRKINLTGK